MGIARWGRWWVCGVLMGLLSACGGGGGGGVDAGAGNGTLRLALTDAPACGYDAVFITVQKIRVHQSASASDNDANWSEIVLNPARRIDLLSLTNGVLFELGQTPLPAGTYTQLRMVLADNGGATPLANAVKPTGGSESALKTPSGQTSGVKANINITISPNQLADFVLDFDACKSVVSAGNSGQYLLKPVVRVVPRFISGVSGTVEASLAANASLSLQQGGVVVAGAVADATGRFLLQPVAPGSYTLVLTAPGRTTLVVTQVPVVADTVTAVGSAAAPLASPASATATVSGTAPLETFVRALQPLTSAPTVEVAGRFVDGVGSYGFLLPVAAPRVAPYAAPPAPLVFTADGAAAARYTLVASLAGFADKTRVLDPLGAGGGVVANFSFP